ncbi:MAG: CPBP family intramembrane metalloprotease [Bifidobacteriaceae bacterium]|jgi:membrane protease YdiL (CAAX protease family)|nr:CPBP family intramembrane metalloprotease [Bifidobacteriaceae bacterium]
MGWAHRLRAEVLIVLGLSLGQSAVYAILRLVDRLTDAAPLADQTAAMNTSDSPKPWLDLLYQLTGISFGLLPAVLALYLLACFYRPVADNAVCPLPSPTSRRAASDALTDVAERGGADRAPRTARWVGAGRIGLTLNRPLRDLAWGAGLAGGIGLPGIGLYLLGRELGMTVHVSTESLGRFWWTIPVLILAAFKNGLVEEVIAVGYLAERLTELGWRPAAWMAASALLRGSYHLYQGFGPFIGNVAMGLVFAWCYRRRGRVMPLVTAHTLIDAVAFTGPGWLNPAWLT